MRESLFHTLDQLLAVNKGGEKKNLLIAGKDFATLDGALYFLRRWIVEKHFHLLELDEACCDWYPEVSSRDLFERLSVPNTVLLVKNYATLQWSTLTEDTPHNFLRDAALHRHYGCGNDWCPIDELPHLLFVVALNDYQTMYWDAREAAAFATYRVPRDSARFDKK